MVSGKETAAVAEGRNAEESTVDPGAERCQEETESAALADAEIADVFLIDLRQGGHMIDHADGTEDAPVEKGFFRSLGQSFTEVVVFRHGTLIFLMDLHMFLMGDGGAVGVGKNAQQGDPAAHVGLKHRETFLNNYLNPAIKDGFVRLLYPDSPRHPRQKYLLTEKGLAAFQELQN